MNNACFEILYLFGLLQVYALIILTIFRLLLSVVVAFRLFILFTFCFTWYKPQMHKYCKVNWKYEGWYGAMFAAIVPKTTPNMDRYIDTNVLNHVFW